MNEIPRMTRWLTLLGLVFALVLAAMLMACGSDDATPERPAPEAVRSEFNTESDVTSDQQQALDVILDDVTGKDVTVAVEEVEIEPGQEQGTFRLTVPVTGLDAGDDVSDVDAELNLGSVTINPPDSAGDRVVTIVLDRTLTMMGEADLVSREGELEVVFQELTLDLKPEAPDASALPGGSQEVTEIGVQVEVEVTSLPPEDASLEVRYSKDPGVFVQDPAAVLSRAASRVRESGVIEDLVEDVAFSVEVTRVNLDNESLGDSVVRLQVSSGWYESRVADGKLVTVVKQDDEGGTFLPGYVGVREVPGEALHEIMASFTGEAGGFSTFTLIAVSSSGPAAATPDQSAIEEDREALVALYNATDGPSWEIGANWLSDLPIDQWGGVNTDADGRVVGLNLLGPGPRSKRVGLTGELPPELGNLTSLTWLSLAQNRFSGGIPPELGNLVNLEYLNLRDSQLSGEIPPELGNLSSLKTLNLSHNQLSGEIPGELGNLSSVEVLNLSYNQLIGPIPAELGNLIGLERLGLEWNQLSGEIPSQLWDLTGTYLSLSPNQDDWCVPTAQLDWWTPYESVDLPDCGSPGLAATATPAATRIVRGNATPMPVLPHTSPETDRAALVALYNATDGPNWLDNENWLSAAPIGEWARVATNDSGRVAALSLFQNQLSGELPPELGNLAHLRSMNLFGNQLSGGLPSELGNLANLQVLDLSWNRLSGEMPPELGNLVNLRSLNLSGNQLSGALPSELGNLGNLTRLDLFGNQLSGETPQELGNLANLQELRLSGNLLSGCIPGSMQGQLDMEMSDLGILPICGAAPAPDLAALVALYNAAGGRSWANNHNWLSDAPLSEWHGVTTDDSGRVVEIYLRNNGLNGEIPSELGDLTHLTRLVLTINRLRGEIPPELGSLSNLQILLLSHNELSGEIPA